MNVNELNAPDVTTQLPYKITDKESQILTPLLTGKNDSHIIKFDIPKNVTQNSSNITNNEIQFKTYLEDFLGSYITKTKIIENKNESYCVRFARKKFQCFVLYTLLLLALIQNLGPLINENLVEHLFNKYLLSPLNTTNICNCNNTNEF